MPTINSSQCACAHQEQRGRFWYRGRRTGAVAAERFEPEAGGGFAARGDQRVNHDAVRVYELHFEVHFLGGAERRRQVDPEYPAVRDIAAAVALAGKPGKTRSNRLSQA